MARPIVLTAATDLASGTTAERFDGAAHGVGVSFFLNHTPPGRGVGAHRTRRPRWSPSGSTGPSADARPAFGPRPR
jgi:hypothetical protein